MAVYVDDFETTGITYRGMKMCHMIADTREELFDMVDKIGVQRKWIQAYGTSREHFDICLTYKNLAIMHGAKEIPMRELAKMTKDRGQKENIEIQ